MAKGKANKKYFSGQFDDEDVLYIFRKHPIVMRKAIVVASVLLLLGTLPSLVKPTYTYFFGGLAIGFILFIAVMFYSWIGWHFSVFVVTTQRFIQMSQHGLWDRSVVDIGLDKIQTISYEINGIQQTLLGFGTIIIQTYVGELVIHEVHHPNHIQKKMSELLRDLNFGNSQSPTGR